MVSSSFDIGLEKKNSKYTERGRESKRERERETDCMHREEAFSPSPRIPGVFVHWQRSYELNVHLYRDASQVPFGHH